MNAILIYFLKVNIAIALFYMFYRLFFAGDTLWKTRRIYMLFTILVSFLYPFLSIQSWIEGQQPVKEILSNYVSLQEFTVTPNDNLVFFSLENVLLTLYGLITFILLIRLILQLSSILKIRLSGKMQLIHGVHVVVLEKEITPFSFFSTIYMNPSLHNDEEKNQILLHELTHVGQLHSVDVVISELLCIAFWINPATWLLKREIRQNLEYLADNQVLESGIDSKSYQYHLLQLSYQCPDYKLTNKFNILPIKKRIIMMNQQKSRKSTVLKYMLIVPLSLTLVFISNAETFASSVEQISQQKVDTPAEKTVNVTPKTNSPSKLDEIVVVDNGQQVDQKKKEQAPPPPPPTNLDEIVVVGYGQQVDQKNKEQAPPPPPAPNDQVFMVVEKMPQYPGGDKELFKYLATTVRYPVEAQKNGIQGRVICSFIVKKDGSIDSVKVLRFINSYLDNEAIRVIKNMPTWTPGEQRGEKVNVKYTLPINFRLDDNSKPQIGVTQKVGSEKQPLYILDGKEVPTDFQINTIKPENIEKIEVLKDASATAIYGEKGKNGVILITMKK